jgi:hypothetical protein
MLICPKLELSGGHHNLLSGSIILILSAKEKRKQQRIGSGEGINILKIYNNLKG